MRTKIIGIVLCIALTGCLLTGCSDITFKGSKNYMERANLIQIDNELYYYESTGIVYIVFNEWAGSMGYGYMAPYYSTDGKLCRYDTTTQSIIEIEN